MVLIPPFRVHFHEMLVPHSTNETNVKYDYITDNNYEGPCKQVYMTTSYEDFMR